MKHFKYEIVDQQEYTADYFDMPGLASMGGKCNEGDMGLGTYEYRFVVEATKDEDIRTFNIVLQSIYRTDGLRVYSGSEIDFDKSAGDESDELLEFLDYNDEFLCNLKEIAQNAADEELERLLEALEQNEE